MKKILVAVLALASVSAFANHKNLVSFDGETLSHFAKYAFGDETKKNNGDTEETSGLDLTVNYAWSVHSNVFVGAILGYSNLETESTTSGTKSTTENKSLDYGFRVIYDLSTDHANSMYAGLSYVIETSEEKTSSSTTKNEEKLTTLSFGKRYSNIAQLAGANVTYSPSIDYIMSDFGKDSATGTQNKKERTAIVLNLVKFDVLF
jgi:hypothetical protein